jgi:hypothetical protein
MKAPPGAFMLYGRVSRNLLWRSHIVVKYALVPAR